MKTVNIHQAKTHLSSLLARLEEDGEGIVICRNGEPVADIVPHRRVTRVRAHPELRRVKISYDPTEPLSSDEWPEGGR